MNIEIRIPGLKNRVKQNARKPSNQEIGLSLGFMLTLLAVVLVFHVKLVTFAEKGVSVSNLDRIIMELVTTLGIMSLASCVVLGLFPRRKQ